MNNPPPVDNKYVKEGCIKFNEPEYIIGGTKVEVGQVWDTKRGRTCIIKELNRNLVYPIRTVGGSLCFDHNGKAHYDGADEHEGLLTYIGDFTPLPDAVGRVVPLEEDNGNYDEYQYLLKDLYFAARGLCYGVDWNKGTHANIYREKIEYCVKRLNDFDDANNLQNITVTSAPKHSMAGLSQPDADGWIAWHGGECPVAEGTDANIKFRDGSGSTYYNVETMTWHHNGGSCDIIAYRIVQPAQSEVNGNSRTPTKQPKICSITGSEIHSKKKLKLSAWEMVRAAIMLMNEDEKADATVYSVLEQIRNNPNLEDYLT